MAPEYKPGDHVLTFNWLGIKKGDVIVFKEEGVKMIKRVKKVERDRVFVEGDNKKESAKMEPIPSSQIVGKVILKY